MRLLVLSVVFLAACPAPTSSPGESDGVGDDTAPDCAEADRGVWYTDGDGDGFGDPDSPVEACVQPSGTVDDATDCDDTAAAVYPGAEEIWYDGADEDCSGGSDFDQDGDGYDRDEECDDLDPQRYPDPEVEERWYDGVDDNCDGNDGDRDGDGFYLADYAFEVPSGFLPGDCLDEPGAVAPALNDLADVAAIDIHPGAADAPYDGIDADCGGGDDFDADRDGFRTDAWPDASGGYGDDCDDSRSDTHPGAPDDWYDGEDADCRGNDDFDQDYDGVSRDDGDCDDTNAAARPGAVESCATEADEDCDGTPNGTNMSGCSLWYQDLDGDGFGELSQCACVAEAPYTAPAGRDCDDTDIYVWPGAPELCDGMRNDCDDSGWVTADEAGTVSYEDAAGVWTDETLAWLGARGAPLDVTLPDSGTVWVCPGVWYATLTGPSGAGSVEVVGREGYEDTVVAAVGTAPVLRVDGSAVSVSVTGLTLTQGIASYGGGVYVTDATVVLESCSLDGNEAEYGGGAYADGGSLSLVGTVVQDNTATVAGGGVYAIDAELDIAGSDLSYNAVDSAANAGGGAVLFTTTGASSLSMDDTVLNYNVSEGAGTYSQGGAVYVSATGSGSVSLTSLFLYGNRAYSGSYVYGGGLRLETGGTVTATVADLYSQDNVIAGNTLGYGGGVYAYHASSQVLEFQRPYVVYGYILAGSAAGGGMFLSAQGGGDIHLSDGTVLGNSAYNAAGTAEGGLGGGVYIAGNGANTVFEGMTIEDNAALNGDGVEFSASSGAQLLISDSDIVDNGGYGLLYYSYDTSSFLQLDNSRVTGHLYYGVYVITAGGYVAEVECVGNARGAAGVYDNGSVGYGGSCANSGGTCRLTATVCDFGPEGSATDNSYTDVRVDNTNVDGWDDDASFSCTNASCR